MLLQYLNDIYEVVECEYRFSDLVDKKELPYDFYVQNRVLIEL